VKPGSGLSTVGKTVLGAAAIRPAGTRAFATPRHAAFLLVGLLLSFSAPALAQRPALATYSEALRTAQQGSPDRAVEMLWTIVREHGQDPIADDALFQIGNICEKQIGDYDQAEKAYLQLMETFPQSKNELKAKQRIEQLRRDRGSGDEPLRILKEIQTRFSQIGEEEALARLRDLYRNYPDFSRRDLVLYMIAEGEYRKREYEAALRDYQELVRKYPQSERVYYVLGRIGKAHIERRDFDAALAAFEKVAEYEMATYGARKSGDEQIRRVHLFQNLRTLFWLSLGIAAAALLVWAAGTRWNAVTAGDLKNAAVDLGILSVLFLLAVTLASDKPWVYQSALIYAWAALGAAAFLNRLFLCTRAPGRGGRILAAAGALLSAAAVVYAVYYQRDMVNLLYDSIQYSMERGEW
jgi:TolA-binding protein